jgi:FtsH-binding integral membrane protein
MTISSRTPDTVRVAQLLFIVNAEIWLLIGIMSLVRITKYNPENPVTAMTIALLMFGNVAAMLLSSIGLGKLQKRSLYFALSVLTINMILSVMDQFGVFDFITLVLDMILFVLLIAARQRYTSSKWNNPTNSQLPGYK